MKDLGIFNEQEVWIDLVDNVLIICKSYKYNEAQKELIKNQIKELLDTKLIKFFNRKYASIILMPSKKDIFGYLTKKQMYSDYRPINKRIKSNKNTIPIFEEIFDIIWHTKVFSTLDLRFGYNQLLVKK